MKNIYSPESTYSFAWQHVCLANQFRRPFESPVNLADMFNLIRRYLNNKDIFEKNKKGFHAFIFEELKLTDVNLAFLEDPKEDLIEFRIVINNGAYYIHFPAEINCGWQTPKFKQHLEDTTFYHGYVKTKGEAMTLYNSLVEGYWAVNQVKDIRKELAITNPNIGAVTECHELSELIYSFTRLRNIKQIIR